MAHAPDTSIPGHPLLNKECVVRSRVGPDGPGTVAVRSPVGVRSLTAWPSQPGAVLATGERAVVVEVLTPGQVRVSPVDRPAGPIPGSSG